MSGAIETLTPVSPQLEKSRRVLLEKQLNLAIRRAEKNYMNTSGIKVEKQTVKTHHLGNKIDVRA